jgi:hypothetical protein
MNSSSKRSPDERSDIRVLHSDAVPDIAALIRATGWLEARESRRQERKDAV